MNSKHLYFSSGVIAVLALSAIARSIVPQSSTHRPTLKVMGAANVPPHVMAALDRACLDCHSNDTRWPWYSRLPFAGEMIGEDVTRARRFMNFSEWTNYSTGQRLAYVTAIGSSSGKTMPPSGYVFAHWSARLSEHDLQGLRQWARAERVRLLESRARKR